MLCSFLPRAAFAALALFASGALFAQQPPTVVIDFGNRSVPLDPWSTVGAALLIAVAAYAWARRVRGVGFGRLSAWIAIIGAATGTALLASKVDLIGRAQAVGPTVVTLTTSPAVIQIGTGFAFLEVHNGTQGPITIASVRLQNPAQGQQIVDAREANCRAGLTLQAGGICFIAVEGAPPA